MYSKQLTVARQTIKMETWNADARKYIEVKPWDIEGETVNTDKLIPLFWSDSCRMWFTIPDSPIDEVLADWLAQWGI